METNTKDENITIIDGNRYEFIIALYNGESAIALPHTMFENITLTDSLIPRKLDGYNDEEQMFFGIHGYAILKNSREFFTFLNDKKDIFSFKTDNIEEGPPNNYIYIELRLADRRTEMFRISCDGIIHVLAGAGQYVEDGPIIMLFEEKLFGELKYKTLDVPVDGTYTNTGKVSDVFKQIFKERIDKAEIENNLDEYETIDIEETFTYTHDTTLHDVLEDLSLYSIVNVGDDFFCKTFLRYEVSSKDKFKKVLKIEPLYKLYEGGFNTPEHNVTEGFTLGDSSTFETPNSPQPDLTDSVLRNNGVESYSFDRPSPYVTSDIWSDTVVPIDTRESPSRILGWARGNRGSGGEVMELVKHNEQKELFNQHFLNDTEFELNVPDVDVENKNVNAKLLRAAGRYKDYASQYVKSRMQSSFIFNNHKLMFDVPGAVYRKAGEFVHIYVSTDSEDKVLEGLWLVVSVTHSITGGVYTNSLQLVKPFKKKQK